MTWNLYANLHTDLMDYSYAQAQQAHQDGTLFVRPMVFAWPDCAECRDMYDQYLYGPDILVAPVWQKGSTTRRVYLPEEGWRDAWTGEPMTAGWHDVAAPLHRIPLYLREGSDVDLGDLKARWQLAVERTADVPDLATLAAGVLPTSR